MTNDMNENRFYVDGYSQPAEPANAFDMAVVAVLEDDEIYGALTGNQITQLEHLLRKHFLPLVEAGALMAGVRP